MDAAKAEKIRIALEKMREAAVQKLFIKVFTSDGSAKSLLVDEKMTVGHVTRLLADKNHVTLEPKWAVLEHLPDLHMGECRGHGGSAPHGSAPRGLASRTPNRPV